MQRKSLKMSCRAWWVAPAQWRQAGEDQRGGIWGFLKKELLFPYHRASKKYFLARWHQFRTLTRLHPPASTVHSTQCAHPSLHSQPGARRSALSGPPCRSQRVSVQRPPACLQFVFVRCSSCCPVCLLLLVAALCITAHADPSKGAPPDRQAEGWIVLPFWPARQRVLQDLCKPGRMLSGCVTGVFGWRLHTVEKADRLMIYTHILARELKPPFVF